MSAPGSRPYHRGSDPALPGASGRRSPVRRAAGDRSRPPARSTSPRRSATCRGSCLLESARPGRNARWTFLTAEPVAVLESPAAGPDPFAVRAGLVARLDRTAIVPADAPPFLGGLVGFLGYDLGGALERLPSIAPADQDLPPLRLALHDWVVAWDRRTGPAWLGGRALDGDGGASRAGSTTSTPASAPGRADPMARSLAPPAPPPTAAYRRARCLPGFRSGLDRAAYLAGGRTRPRRTSPAATSTRPT